MARITNETMTAMEVIMSKDARRKLKELAEKRTAENGTVTASDIVRSAVTDYVKREFGVDLDFGVNRGGDRREKPE